MSAYRKEKIEAEIRRIIAEAFIKEIKDPRIGFITVTSAKISKDYKVVNVGISVIGDDREQESHARGCRIRRGVLPAPGGEKPETQEHSPDQVPS